MHKCARLETIYDLVSKIGELTKRVEKSEAEIVLLKESSAANKFISREVSKECDCHKSYGPLAEIKPIDPAILNHLKELDRQMQKGLSHKDNFKTVKWTKHEKDVMDSDN